MAISFVLSPVDQRYASSSDTGPAVKISLSLHNPITAGKSGSAGGAAITTSFVMVVSLGMAHGLEIIRLTSYVPGSGNSKLMSVFWEGAERNSTRFCAFLIIHSNWSVSHIPVAVNKVSSPIHRPAQVKPPSL